MSIRELENDRLADEWGIETPHPIYVGSYGVRSPNDIRSSGSSRLLERWSARQEVLDSWTWATRALSDEVMRASARALEDWDASLREAVGTTRSVLIYFSDPETARPARDVLAERFTALAEEWKRETVPESSVQRMAMHKAYQQIIGLGVAAVPLILRELEREPNYWFWALSAITGEDPAAREDTLDGATARWLEWGRRRGYLP